MADDIMALDERLARLEKTVATGFSEMNGRITTLEHKLDTLDGKFDTLERKVDGLHARVDALNGKLDVVSESLESKIQLVLERIDSRTNELHASIRMMQRESWPDRRLMDATLTDLGVRIEALEGNARRGAADPSTP